MGEKVLDNKKLTKTLIIVGCGLLFLFMILRLLFRSTGISEAENPDIKNIDNGQINLPKEKTSVEKLEAQERKKNQPTSEQKNNYVYHDFDKMLKETGTAKSPEPFNEIKKNSTETVNVPAQASYKKESSYNNIAIQQNNGGKINKSEETKIESSQPTYESPKKSVFGTVRIEETIPTSTVTFNHFEGKLSEIYGDQKITNGSAVLIRNKEKIVAEDGLVIPPHSILTGQASFIGNRVAIQLNKVQTKDSVFNINMYVLDHDNIEGIPYQAPIDQAAGSAVDNSNGQVNTMNVTPNPVVAQMLSSVSNGLVRAGKDLIKKSRSLDLTDGYGIYIVPRPKNANHK